MERLMDNPHAAALRFGVNLILNAIEAVKETGGVLTVKDATGPAWSTADLRQRYRRGAA
jgi:hypothetical protein